LARSTTVQIQDALEQAITLTNEKVGDQVLPVIAEFPAHLPAVEADLEGLVQVIASLLTAVMERAVEDEVHLYAELFAAEEGGSTLKAAERLQPQLRDTGPWGIITIADVDFDVPLRPYEISVSSSYDMEALLAKFPLSLKECGWYIHQYGGHLWVDTIETRGTRVRLALPLRAARNNIADMSSLKRLVETRLPEDVAETKQLLLMVEDDDMRNQLAHDLVEAGYEVILPPDGGAVVTLARREKPDLILLDLLMREPAAMDIALVLKQARRTKDIPILFLTTIDDPQGGVQMGAASFMVKPVGTGALLATVNAVITAGLTPTSRILVVEPDEVLRENLVMMIQAHGYGVIEARSPEEAVALAERVSIGLVLANAQIAQEGDYWLVRQLRQSSGDIEIYVMAEMLTDEEGQAAMSRGAAGYSDTGKLPDLLDRVRGGQNEGEDQ
jgi:DNA-binding response OmpR family regulator